jgi:hypothetical protein
MRVMFREVPEEMVGRQSRLLEATRIASHCFEVRIMFLAFKKEHMARREYQVLCVRR